MNCLNGSYPLTLAKTYQNETDRTVYEYAILLQLYDCL